MKSKLFFLVALNMTLLGYSQIELVPNPCDINTGTIILKYGETGDYSIFDPMSDPNLYLYTGLQTDSDPITWDYHDDFMDVGTLIPLTYNGALGYYEATFNPATRSYLEEPALNTVTIPFGTQVFDWYFLIRNLDGSRQSADLKGSDYGFGPATLLSLEDYSTSKNFVAFNGKIKFYKQGIYTIDVFDILGKLVSSEIKEVGNESLYDLSLPTGGVFLIRMRSNDLIQTIKMVKF